MKIEITHQQMEGMPQVGEIMTVTAQMKSGGVVATRKNGDVFFIYSRDFQYVPSRDQELTSPYGDNNPPIAP